MKVKEMKTVRRYFKQKTYVTVVTFDDDSVIYIFIQHGMIYVADCDWDELTERINNDDTESFEAYDTLDGWDYYSKSEYAEYINCSLLRLANGFLV